MEDQFHISIFSRSKNGIILTESGQLFIQMAKDLLDNAKHFQKTFEDRQDNYRLRISSCTCSHPIDAFIRMVNTLPDSSLHFSYREVSNIDVINDIYTQRSDIGVISSNSSNIHAITELLTIRHIVCHKLFDTGFWLVTRNGHPLLSKKGTLTLDDIYQYNLVLYPSSQNSQIQAMESIYSDAVLSFLDSSKFKQIIYVYSRASLHSILERTDYIGIGIAPTREQEQNFHISSIPLPKEISSRKIRELDSTLCYIYLKDRELPKAARAYITFLENYYGEKSNYMNTF